MDYPTGRHERLVLDNDPMRYYSWNMILNATRPDKSAVLMAPLPRAAGGWGVCGDVFKSRDDPDYKTMARAAKAWQAEWLKAGRFGSPSFRVNHQYVREMVRFGILPADITPDKVDPYETDRLYWKKFDYDPAAAEAKASAKHADYLSLNSGK
jgi:hypothetical protein